MKFPTSSKRQFKDEIYEQFSRVGKAVSSAKRLELSDLLCQGERTVEALAAEAELSIANTSQHLQVLRASRLVEGSKEGLYVTYRIAHPPVGEFGRSIRVLAEKQLVEVEQISRRFFERRQDLDQLGWLRLADTLNSFRWLFDHPLRGFIEIECAAFAVGLYRHRDGRLSSISRVGVEHRLLPRPHAIQEVHHVCFARLALDLDLNPIAEPAFELFLGNPLRNNGDVLNPALEFAMGNHNDRSFMSANETRNVCIVGH
jgi:DNA-binding transcriptional ArsR family regulator